MPIPTAKRTRNDYAHQLFFSPFISRIFNFFVYLEVSSIRTSMLREIDFFPIKIRNFKLWKMRKNN